MCDASKLLISLMKSENIIMFFYTVCVDGNKNIPPIIKSTPTILIKGISTPYVGSDAFTWLSKVKQWKINVIMQKASAAQHQHMQTINNNLTASTTSLLGFSNAEMNGMSDIFAYLQNDNAMPHTYVDCKDLGTETIFTPPLEDGGFKVQDGGKYKLGMAGHKAQCKKLISDRNKQDITIKQSIDSFVKKYNN